MVLTEEQMEFVWKREAEMRQVQHEELKTKYVALLNDYIALMEKQKKYLKEDAVGKD